MIPLSPATAGAPPKGSQRKQRPPIDSLREPKQKNAQPSNSLSSGRGGSQRLTERGQSAVTNMLIKKNKNLLNIAKILRRNMTPQEKHLWYDFLRHYPIKVYKQRIIDDFVVDFFCYQAKLVIELDGSQHYTQNGQNYDAERTNVLAKHGLLVLRFSNQDVEKDFEGVCDRIDMIIRERSI